MGQGWHIGSVLISSLFVAILSGCGNGQGSWSSFPVPIYADSSLVSTREGETDLTDAMAFWEKSAGKKLFDYKGAWNGNSPYTGSAGNISTVTANVIFFQNPWPFAGNIAGRTTTIRASGVIENALVMINPNLSFCSGDCRGSNGRTSIRNTLAHELGHFLGLGHTEDANNIMYPDVLTTNTLTNVSIDRDALKAATDI